MAEIEKLDLTSMDIKEHQIEKLKELFPEAFTEGSKIDWDRLRRTLGEQIDAGKERYGMNWPGKADCFRTIQQPSIATLVPAREESVDFDATQKLFIEGDNLEKNYATVRQIRLGADEDILRPLVLTLMSL